jgi:PBP1b-binding outer membrane lipoprotein LpoB
MKYILIIALVFYSCAHAMPNTKLSGVQTTKVKAFDCEYADLESYDEESILLSCRQSSGQECCTWLLTDKNYTLEMCYDQDICTWVPN